MTAQRAHLDSVRCLGKVTMGSPPGRSSQPWSVTTRTAAPAGSPAKPNDAADQGAPVHRRPDERRKPHWWWWPCLSISPVSSQPRAPAVMRDLQRTGCRRSGSRCFPMASRKSFAWAPRRPEPRIAGRKFAPRRFPAMSAAIGRDGRLGRGGDGRNRGPASARLSFLQPRPFEPFGQSAVRVHSGAHRRRRCIRPQPTADRQVGSPAAGSGLAPHRQTERHGRSRPSTAVRR